jgi:acid phosphatase class B
MPNVDDVQEQVFWDEVNNAFNRSASDPEELARQRAEIAIWEQASSHDLVEET